MTIASTPAQAVSLGEAEFPGAEKVHAKPGERLQCVVVTPERTVLDELAEFVALPLSDGELGVLPGRTPLIGRLGFGELRLRAPGAPARRYFVDGGFAQIRDDVVTVLTGRALPADQIDATAAAQELEQAQARRAVTEFDQEEKARAVARARALLRIAGSR